MCTKLPYHTVVTLENHFFSATRYWTLACGYRWYCWLTLATAGLLVLCRFPHPVTLGGMLEMSIAYLPVNKNWQLYIDRSQAKYDELQLHLSSMLTRLAKEAVAMPQQRSIYFICVQLCIQKRKKIKFEIKSPRANMPLTGDSSFQSVRLQLKLYFTKH